MPGTFFVVGPTSVGKSALALSLAEKTHGEIVNADAFQVYDGLEMLTARPGPADCERVSHHLFGFVPLGESFNVAQYVTRARACIAEIHARGNPAIIVGGTGLYIKALTHGLSPLPPADPALRARLEAKGLEQLVAALGAVDPAGCREIDLRNKRRVVRALEICESTGRPFSSHRDSWQRSAYGTGGAGVYLERVREDLRARIDRRVESMFCEGVVEEVRRLPAGGVGDTASGAIGLAEIRCLLAGAMSPHDCVERVKIRTKQYAKRQVTWFKREQVFRRVALSSDWKPESQFLLQEFGFFFLEHYLPAQ